MFSLLSSISVIIQRQLIQPGYASGVRTWSTSLSIHILFYYHDVCKRMQARRSHTGPALGRYDESKEGNDTYECYAPAATSLLRGTADVPLVERGRSSGHGWIGT